MTSVHFSSKTDNWETPQDLFDELHERFAFTLDVCANKKNAKVLRHFNRRQNGLIQSWNRETCWMNPPYGREIGKWVSKASQESSKRAVVVCLLPARTDTSWWHNYIEGRSRVTVRFIRGRLKFSGHKNSAPFPSVIVVMRPERYCGNETPAGIFWG